MTNHAQTLADAIAEFPPTFGLRAFPGRQFRIDEAYSYVDHGTLVVNLVVVVEAAPNDWRHFTRTTPAELHAETIALD